MSSLKQMSSPLSALALTASAGRYHAESTAPAPPAATHAESPRPGVPQEERALLEREYGLNEESQCTRSAMEVVDIQHRCSETRWADCYYAATMYWLGCGVAHEPTQAEALFRRSCDSGSMLGCAMAGAGVETAQPKGN